MGLSLINNFLGDWGNSARIDESDSLPKVPSLNGLNDKVRLVSRIGLRVSASGKSSW